MCSPTKDLLKQSSENDNDSNKVSAENQNPKTAVNCAVSSPTPSTSSGSISPLSAGGTDFQHLANNYPIITRNQLEVGEQLGAGTYGAVFRGWWRRNSAETPETTADTATTAETDDRLQVALKKVFMLEKEVEILSQIRHRNIIQFYGVSPANPDYWIVTEFAEGGSLFDQLHNGQHPLNFARIIKWAVQIARGVVYLHHEAPLTVIHRDLKSRNIVIGSKNQCKICDFGTSKELTHSWTVPTWGGTAAWMSPEIISQRPEGITTATDVWSYAVVLWELFSHEIPYNGLTEFKIYSIISQHGVRLVIPETCPALLQTLLESCWRTEPGDRPDMKYVLAILEQIGTDADLQREVTQFLTLRKDEWREQIRDQLGELEELKLDLARQMEDLRRREAIVRKREHSHRNFLHMVDVLNVEDVCEWNEDCVCEWVQNIAACTMEDFSDEMVDLLVCCILQYEINGARLLKITEKDLECLGIESVAVRRYIVLKLDELRAMNVRLCNFGCPDTPSTSAEANQCCAFVGVPSSSRAQNPKPIERSILLHVGMYSRMVSKPGQGQAYRFKVFLDSDWEASTAPTGLEEAEEELPDSSLLIKEVNISMSTVDHSPLLEPVQCICPPFGYLEWAQLDAVKERRKLPLTVTIGVTYTDQVVQPRNTRIQIQLDTLNNGPRTLCNKRVALRIKQAPPTQSLSRISSQMLLKSPPPSMNALRNGRRRRSVGLQGESISPEIGRTMSSSITLLNRSTIWADLAATIRNPTICAIRPISKSISLENPSTNPNGDEQKGNAETENGPADTKVMSAADSMQRARQNALARVRKQRQQNRNCGRKKCASETESINSASDLDQRRQQMMTKFYVGQPSTSESSSLSPSPAASKNGGSGGSTADTEGSATRRDERCARKLSEIGLIEKKAATFAGLPQHILPQAAENGTNLCPL